MPYSENQRQAAGIALSALRGKTPVSKLRGASLSFYNSVKKGDMSMAELRRMASGPIKKKK